MYNNKGGTSRCVWWGTPGQMEGTRILLLG